MSAAIAMSPLLRFTAISLIAAPILARFNSCEPSAESSITLQVVPLFVGASGLVMLAVSASAVTLLRVVPRITLQSGAIATPEARSPKPSPMNDALLTARLCALAAGETAATQRVWLAASNAALNTSAALNIARIRPGRCTRAAAREERSNKFTQRSHWKNAFMLSIQKDLVIAGSERLSETLCWPSLTPRNNGVRHDR